MKKNSENLRQRFSHNVGFLNLFLKLSILIIFTSLALEGALRLRENMRSEVGGSYPGIYYQHKLLQHALIPNTSHFKWLQINSLGFRGSEITLKKPPNTVRIVCLGGSTTFDTKVSSNEKTWPRQLEKVLREKYPHLNIQVINAGVGGYKAIQSLNNLQTRILPLEPDIVVTYHAHNDIAANRNTYLPTKENPRPGAIENESSIFRVLKEHSLLYQKINLVFRFFIKKREGEQSTRQDEISQEGLSNFERTLSLIAFTLAENNIKFVMPHVITGYREEMPRVEQLQNAKWTLHFFLHLSLTGVYDGYSKHNHVIRKTANRFGGLFVDSTRKIPGGSDYFADGIHFTDKGSLLFAEIIGREIYEAGLMNDLIASNHLSNSSSKP